MQKCDEWHFISPASEHVVKSIHSTIPGVFPSMRYMRRDPSTKLEKPLDLPSGLVPGDDKFYRILNLPLLVKMDQTSNELMDTIVTRHYDLERAKIYLQNYLVDYANTTVNLAEVGLVRLLIELPREMKLIPSGDIVQIVRADCSHGIVDRLKLPPKN